jgi:hypothetical protein
MVGALPFAGGHRDDCPVVGANGIASKPRVAWASLRRIIIIIKKEKHTQKNRFFVLLFFPCSAFFL